MFGYNRFDREIPDESSDDEFASDESSDYSDSDLEDEGMQNTFQTRDQTDYALQGIRNLFRTTPDSTHYEGLDAFGNLFSSESDIESFEGESTPSVTPGQSKPVQLSPVSSFDWFESRPERAAHIQSANVGGNYPDEDKYALSQVGYDIEDFCGQGSAAVVYSGTCNEKATKLYPLNTFQRRDSSAIEVIRISGKRFELRSLNGKKFAVKLIQLTGSVGSRQQLSEARLLERLNHKNIVDMYYATTVQNERLYIFMEYTVYGTLRNYLDQLDQMNERINEDLFKALCKQLTKGLKYLHEMEIAHCDLHIGNVLVFQTNKIVLKLADFGLSMETTEADPRRSDIRQLANCFENISTMTNFVDQSFENRFRGLVDHMYRGRYDSMNDLLRNNHWLYPKFFRSPQLWLPNPDECIVM